MGGLFRLLRYPFIFFVAVVFMAIYSNAHASSLYQVVGTGWVDSKLIQERHEANVSKTLDFCKVSYSSCYRANLKKTLHPDYPSTDKQFWNEDVFSCSVNDSDPKCNPEPCKTPKTDEQCKKGQRRQVTLPKSFWSQSTAEHKGCVIAVESPGVGIANMGDDRATGHVNMMGSTGKEWCGNTGTSDTTAQSIGASGEFTPTTTPKDCPKGSVTMGGQSWCYTGASDGVTKPDGSVPDDGIHDNGTSDDGNGGDVDSSIDREPGGGGDGGGGDTGGGGGGSGGGTGDGNGISKGDIKDGVKEGVEEALGSKSGSPAPFVPPSVEGVEGGINGVMTRYKQRINASPVISAANNLRFSAPSSGCTPWSVHLDFLDQTVSFDQCNFLITNSEKVGYLMLAAYAIAALIIFLKA